jgi:hypothetical protein
MSKGTVEHVSNPQMNISEHHTKPSSLPPRQGMEENTKAKAQGRKENASIRSWFPLSFYLSTSD